MARDLRRNSTYWIFCRRGELPSETVGRQRCQQSSLPPWRSWRRSQTSFRSWRFVWHLL